MSLTCYQLLPFARSAQLLHDLLGVSLSPGTLSTAQRQCSERLAPVTQQIKAALTRAKRATSMRPARASRAACTGCMWPPRRR